MHRVHHPHVEVGWREILSWYPVEWTMEMVVDPGGAQQEFPITGDAGILNWHWDLGGTTYHFPGIPIDYNLEGS